MTELEQRQQFEARRRAMLGALQVDLWLPRQALPYAAPSPAWLLDFEPASAADCALPELAATETPVIAAQQALTATPATAAQKTLNKSTQASHSLSQLKQQLTNEPVAAAPSVKPQLAQTEQATEVAEPPLKPVIPRFTLQLLRAGNCLLLLDLRTAEGYQRSDPDYRLLSDMLRAAGIQEAPQMTSPEPMVWPMLTSGALAQTQDASAALDAVQYLLKVEIAKQAPACIWLLGSNAMRFAAEQNSENYYQIHQLEGLGNVWCLPSLELILDEPERKADIWRSMQANSQLWSE